MQNGRKKDNRMKEVLGSLGSFGYRIKDGYKVPTWGDLKGGFKIPVTEIPPYDPVLPKQLTEPVEYRFTNTNLMSKKLEVIGGYKLPIGGALNGFRIPIDQHHQISETLLKGVENFDHVLSETEQHDLSGKKFIKFDSGKQIEMAKILI